MKTTICKLKTSNNIKLQTQKLPPFQSIATCYGINHETFYVDMSDRIRIWMVEENYDERSNILRYCEFRLSNSPKSILPYILRRMKKWQSMYRTVINII